MTPAPSAVTTPEARPVDSGERLVLLDTLRGFALCGVFISNTFMWFSGRAFIPREQLEALFANGTLLDKILLPVVTTLVSGRFITLFSFLFGLGFAVQLGRAEARGSPIHRVYVRRLAVMLLLGLTHMTLIWYGDILCNYALIGFCLLWFRRREDRTILKVAAVLLFAWPIVSAFVFKLPQLMAASPEAAAELAKVEMERGAALKADTLATFQNGNWWAVVKAGLYFWRREFLLMMSVNALALLGRFLLGFYAGRKRLFHDAPQHLAFFRRLFFWGLGLGLLGSSVGVVLQQLMLRKVITPETLPVWVPMVLAPVRAMGELGMAATYVSGITLLFQRATWQRLLSVLAPVGRMALTNYLSQSVISTLVFYGYGLGLVAKLTPSLSILYCLGVFSVQIVVSHLWLARFRFGPAEWVWRSLTYGKAQPMRRSTEAAGPAVATS